MPFLDRLKRYEQQYRYNPRKKRERTLVDRVSSQSSSTKTPQYVLRQATIKSEPNPFDDDFGWGFDLDKEFDFENDEKNIDLDEDQLADVGLDAQDIQQTRDVMQSRQPKMGLYDFIKYHGVYGTGWDEICPPPESVLDYLKYTDEIEPIDQDKSVSIVERLMGWSKIILSEWEIRQENKLVNQRIEQFVQAILEYDSLSLIDEHFFDYRVRSDLLPRRVIRRILRIRTNREGHSTLYECLLRLTDPEASDEIQQQALDDLSNVIEDGIYISERERQFIQQLIYDELFGYGLLESLLKNEAITAIHINGNWNIFIETRGQLQRYNDYFDDDRHLRRIINRLIAPLGIALNEENPFFQSRLPDGSRINVISPPISLMGTSVSIHKMYRHPLVIQDLIRFGTLTVEIAELLRACVIAKLSIIVVGGHGSGKKTLVNILSGFIPNDERIFSIESSALLQLQQEHVITLEVSAYNDGDEETNIAKSDLIAHALNMRPTRIVVTDLQDDTAAFLNAIQSGVEGSLATMNSNSVQDALNLIESRMMIANSSLTTTQARTMIAKTIDFIVHIDTLIDGSRKIMQVVEVQDVEYERFKLATIFGFEQTGIERGKIVGRIRPTGVRPECLQRIEDRGILLPPSVFGIGNTRY